MDTDFNASQLMINGSTLNGSLMKLLMADDIQPGSDPSYQLCKIILSYHPLGAKMAEAPVSMAQSQPRTVVVQDAPDEVIEAYETEWEALSCDAHIHNLMRLSRAYGIAAIVIGCEEVDSDKPLDMDKIWNQQIYFNVLDPLNTAGSLVLNQNSNAPDFNKPVTVASSGQVFHRSRYQISMNEAPIFLQYTTSAFGFVGRSVYQRALFPLKSFIRSMIADDMIATKLGLLVAKQKAPGSIIDKAMQRIAGLKRSIRKGASTGNVLSIDLEEEIETLDMQNVDGAGSYSRTNILKNIATAADMPAKLLENETMVSGFGEGTEDAKSNARYIEGIRKRMQPHYAWFDNIVRHRAWNPAFYERMQAKYPDQFASVAYLDAFSQWRHSFKASWPSFLIETESEQIKVDQIKFEAAIAVLEVLMEKLDPDNLARVIQWMADSMNDNERLFQHELSLDYEALVSFLEENQERLQESHEASLEAPAAAPGGKPGGKVSPMKKVKLGGGQ